MSDIDWVAAANYQQPDPLRVVNSMEAELAGDVTYNTAQQRIQRQMLQMQQPATMSTAFEQTALGSERELADYVPFVSAARQVGDMAALMSSMDRSLNGVADSADEERLARFVTLANREKTAGYLFGTVFAESIPFAGEFALTGGAGKVTQKLATELTKRGLMKTARKAMMYMLRPGRTAARNARVLAAQGKGLTAGLTEMAATVPRQAIGQAIIGETLGGSRLRAAQYGKYIENRYGVEATSNGNVVRIADDTYGMWTNALPAGVIDYVTEIFSEASGEALVHLIPALKLALTGKRFAKTGTSNRMLSYLGLSADPTYAKYWHSFGFSGVLPEVGEEFIGGFIRDGIHQIAPELADGGNVDSLVEHIAPITLGMMAGMFLPASVIGTANRVQNNIDIAVSYSKMPKKAQRLFKQIAGELDPAQRKAVARAFAATPAIINNVTLEGSAQLLQTDSVRDAFLASETVKRLAQERIIQRATAAGQGEADVSPDAIEQEMDGMWADFLTMPLMGEDRKSTPAIQQLIDWGVIDSTQAPEMVKQVLARVDELRKAYAEGTVGDFLKAFGARRAAQEMEDAAKRGLSPDTISSLEAAVASITAEKEAGRVQAVLDSDLTPEEKRDTLETIFLQEALMPAPGAATVAQAEKSAGEVAQARDAATALAEEAQSRLEALQQDEELLADNPGLAELEVKQAGASPRLGLAAWAAQSGLAIVTVDGPANIRGVWDPETGTMFLNESAIVRHAERLGKPVEEVARATYTHEVIHAVVTSLGERGRAWLQMVDEFLSEYAGFPDKRGDTDMRDPAIQGDALARLEESIAYRLQRYAEAAQTPTKELLGEDKEQELTFRGLIKRLLQGLLDMIVPRTRTYDAMAQAADRLKGKLGVEGRSMSEQEVIANFMARDLVARILSMDLSIGEAVEQVAEQAEELAPVPDQPFEEEQVQGPPAPAPLQGRPLPEQAAPADALDEMTYRELQRLAKSMGVPATGKRAALQERVRVAMQEAEAAPAPVQEAEQQAPPAPQQTPQAIPQQSRSLSPEIQELVDGALEAAEDAGSSPARELVRILQDLRAEQADSRTAASRRAEIERDISTMQAMLAEFGVEAVLAETGTEYRGTPFYADNARVIETDDPNLDWTVVEGEPAYMWREGNRLIVVPGQTTIYRYRGSERRTEEAPRHSRAAEAVIGRLEGHLSMRQAELAAIEAKGEAATSEDGARATELRESIAQLQADIAQKREQLVASEAPLQEPPATQAQAKFPGVTPEQLAAAAEKLKRPAQTTGERDAPPKPVAPDKRKARPADKPRTPAAEEVAFRGLWFTDSVRDQVNGYYYDAFYDENNIRVGHGGFSGTVTPQTHDVNVDRQRGATAYFLIDEDGFERQLDERSFKLPRYALARINPQEVESGAEVMLMRSRGYLDREELTSGTVVEIKRNKKGAVTGVVVETAADAEGTRTGRVTVGMEQLYDPRYSWTLHGTPPLYSIDGYRIRGGDDLEWKPITEPDLPGVPIDLGDDATDTDIGPDTLLTHVERTVARRLVDEGWTPTEIVNDRNEVPVDEETEALQNYVVSMRMWREQYDRVPYAEREAWLQKNPQPRAPKSASRGARKENVDDILQQSTRTLSFTALGDMLEADPYMLGQLLKAKRKRGGGYTFTVSKRARARLEAQARAGTITPQEQEQLEVITTYAAEAFLEPISDVVGGMLLGEVTPAQLVNELHRLRAIPEAELTAEEQRRLAALGMLVASIESAGAKTDEMAMEIGRLMLSRFGQEKAEMEANVAEGIEDLDYAPDSEEVTKVGSKAPTLATRPGQRINRNLATQAAGRALVSAFGLYGLTGKQQQVEQELNATTTARVAGIDFSQYRNFNGSTTGEWFRRWGADTLGRMDSSAMSALHVAAVRAPRNRTTADSNNDSGYGQTDHVYSTLTELAALVQTGAFGPTINWGPGKQAVSRLPVTPISDSTAEKLVELVLPAAVLQDNMPRGMKKGRSKDEHMQHAARISRLVAQHLVHDQYDSLNRLLEDEGYMAAAKQLREWLDMAPEVTQAGSASAKRNFTKDSVDETSAWIDSLRQKSEWSKALGKRGAELNRALHIAAAFQAIRALKMQHVERITAMDSLQDRLGSTEQVSTAQLWAGGLAEDVIPSMWEDIERLGALEEALLEEGNLSAVRVHLENDHVNNGTVVRYSSKRVSVQPQIGKATALAENLRRRAVSGSDVLVARRGSTRVTYVLNPMVIHRAGAGAVTEVDHTNAATPVGRMRLMLLESLDALTQEAQGIAANLLNLSTDAAAYKAQLQTYEKNPATADIARRVVTLLEQMPESERGRLTGTPMPLPWVEALNDLYGMDVQVAGSGDSFIITSRRDKSRKISVRWGRAMDGEQDVVTYRITPSQGLDEGVADDVLVAIVRGLNRAHRAAQNDSRAQDDAGAWAYDVRDLTPAQRELLMLKKTRTFDYGGVEYLRGSTVRTGKKLRKAGPVRFDADQFADETDYNTAVNEARAVQVPKSWDADTLPGMKDEAFNTALFLQAYDEWWREVNEATTEASIVRRLNEERLRRFVEKEGHKGKAFFDRRDELDEALMWYINMTGFLTERGQKELVEILFSRRRRPKPKDWKQPKTLQELWDLFGLEDEADLKMFELVKQIDAAGRVLGHPMRDLYDFAEDLVQYSAAGTEIALRSNLIGRTQERFVHLAWEDKDGNVVDFSKGPTGLVDLTGAGGPMRFNLGAEAMKRRIAGILEGRSLGLKLRHTSALDAMMRTRRLIAEARYNKAMFVGLEKTGIIVLRQPGQPPRQGFENIEVLKMEGYQAPAWIAKYINNAMTQYGINDIKNPIGRAAMKMNVLSKHILLSFGFFHHQAFARSFLFTVRSGDALQAIKGLGALGMASVLTYGSLMGVTSESTIQNLAAKWAPYRLGREALLGMSDEVRLLVRNGMTTNAGGMTMQAFHKSGYDPETLRSGYETVDLNGTYLDPKYNEDAKKWYSKATDAIAKMEGGTISEGMKSVLQRIQRAQFETATFLFNSFGAFSKTHAGVLKFRELKAKHAKELLDDDGSLLDDLARAAADSVNRDFGGLNLRSRSGKVEDLFTGGAPRNPRTHMWLRALLLAPDWTESNLATMLAAIRKEKIYGRPEKQQEMVRNVYRLMWLRVAGRAQAIQVLGMAMMAGMDDDRDIIDMYKDAGIPFFGSEDAPDWQKLRWLLDVDVSALTKELGVENKRKYVSIWGHFGDGLKWTVDTLTKGPLEVPRRKLSPVGSMAFEYLTGRNWKGQRYTTFNELLGLDFDAGTYQRRTVLADGRVMYPGMSRAGQKQFQLSKFSITSGTVSLQETPSYILGQAGRFVPLQSRSFVELLSGNKDGFDFLMEVLGVKAHNFVEGRNL